MALDQFRGILYEHSVAVQRGQQNCVRQDSISALDVVHTSLLTYPDSMRGSGDAVTRLPCSIRRTSGVQKALL